MAKKSDLITLTSRGLYCERGDFYIDAWKPVPQTIVTHAHGDHAHYGHGQYFCSEVGEGVTRLRVGQNAIIEGLPYGKVVTMGDTKVSLHPAGHILGSAQVRVECDGEVWVFTGDCKRDPDPTCAPFEVVECDTFITEATFALPIYKWRSTSEIAKEIHEWWMKNREHGRNSVLCVYALGKAQRVLAELSKYTNEPVYIHGALSRLTEMYRRAGIHMLPTLSASQASEPEQEKPKARAKQKTKMSGQLILCPPSASGSIWMRRFEPYEVAFASGWMSVRGNRRRESYDRGFVISDHSDWPSLIRTIKETKAKRVLATHGASDVLARYVTEEMKLQGDVLKTQFHPELEDADGGKDEDEGGASFLKETT